MSARAPAGRINRKNGSVDAVDIRERNKVDWLMLFITQVAAVSCADTKVPETTVANQSLRKVGFCKALHVDVAVIQEPSELLLQNTQTQLTGYHGRNHIIRSP